MDQTKDAPFNPANAGEFKIPDSIRDTKPSLKVEEVAPAAPSEAPVIPVAPTESEVPAVKEEFDPSKFQEIPRSVADAVKPVASHDVGMKQEQEINIADLQKAQAPHQGGIGGLFRKLFRRG